MVDDDGIDEFLFSGCGCNVCGNRIPTCGVFWVEWSGRKSLHMKMSMVGGLNRTEVIRGRGAYSRDRRNYEH